MPANSPTISDEKGGGRSVLTIGEFARRTYLSPKALRLYDELGLLRPARVDPGTGYRFYTVDQVETARLVAQCRRLDMPLTEIRSILELPPREASHAVGEWWSGVEARVEEMQSIVHHVQARLMGEVRSVGGRQTTWATNLDGITLFFEDLPEATAFYERVFDLPVEPVLDGCAVCMVGNVKIILLDVRSARELVAPEKVAPRDGGHREQRTIVVDEVDKTVALLKGRGVTFLKGPIDRPEGIRTASFADPGGHVWELLQWLPE